MSYLPLREICGNCGLLFGSHHGSSGPWPYSYCPGHEGRMDWENGPGTVFKYTGKFTDDKEEEEEEDVLHREVQV